MFKHPQKPYLRKVRTNVSLLYNYKTNLQSVEVK